MKLLVESIKYWLRRHGIDTLGHFAWAVMVVVPAMVLPGPLGGAIAGTLLSLPRELWDQKPESGFVWKLPIRKISDILGFALGGAVAGGIIKYCF